MTASTIEGISSGKANPKPSTRAAISCTAASIKSGKFSMSAPTIVMTASTAAGISSGSRLSKVSRTWLKRSVTVLRRTGRRSPIASRMASIAAGRAVTTFSNIGTILITTDWKASTRFWVRFVISASAFPRPAVNEPRAACRRPMDPVTVWVDSLAKFPAYCSVFSKNICMATSAFSAFVADAQVKSNPLARA